MALMTCKHCGRKISDTVTNCIHCGKSTVEETTTVNETELLAETQDNEATEIQPVSNRKEFSTLSKKEQETLVHEFWKIDKTAYKYKKKTTLLEKFGEGFSIIYFIPFLLYLLADRVLKLKPQNQTAFKIFVIIPLAMIVFEIVKVLLYILILKPLFNTKIKKMAYSKRFQVWVTTEKNIDYSPVFIDKKEEQMYEQLDVNKIVL